jgi:ABC-2 type transport system permease protein
MIKGYTSNEMMSYVVFSWFFAFLTTNYAFEQNVAKDIQLGTLSNFLVKPMSYMRYMVAISLGRISIAFIVVLMQGALVMYMFNSILRFSLDLKTACLLLAMLVASYFINLFMAILIGMIAFWTTEIVGIQYSIKVFVKLISGLYFPINLLPVAIINISMLFPFIYTVFIPVQLYLGKISFMEGLKGFGVEILWLILLYVVIKIVWKFGLKKYESVGI